MTKIIILFYSKGVNMFLYHYFDKTNKPFSNLSELSLDEANKILEQNIGSYE
jgi:hypothetical protein